MRETKKDRPEVGTSERPGLSRYTQHKTSDMIIVLQAAAKGKRNFSRRGGALQ